MKICLSKFVSLACIFPILVTPNTYAAISSLIYSGHDKKMVFNQDNVIVIDFENLDKIHLHLHVGKKPKNTFIEHLNSVTQTLDPKLKSLALFSDVNPENEQYRIIIGPVPLDKIFSYSDHYKKQGYDNFPILYSDDSATPITKNTHLMEKTNIPTDKKIKSNNKTLPEKSSNLIITPLQKIDIQPEKNHPKEIHVNNLIVGFEKSLNKKNTQTALIKDTDKKTNNQRKPLNDVLKDYKKPSIKNNQPIDFTKNTKNTNNKPPLDEAVFEKNKKNIANESEELIEKKNHNFLYQYGTAQIGLDIGSSLAVESAEITYLYPFNIKTTESNTSALFLQTNMTLNNGVNYHGRTFINFGLGYRSLSDKSLIGVNSFLDSSFTQGHKRLSIGAEYATPYVNFHTNYYFPLSDWKKSRDITTAGKIVLPFESRPAKGFDTHIEGHLPSLPWVYIDFNYQRYFGELGEIRTGEEPIEDPYTISSNINFQPVPLITMSAGYQKEEGGQEAATLAVDMNYRLGVPIDRQLDPSQVSVAKSLDMSLFEFVKRDNNMRMEYREPTKPVVQFNRSKVTVTEGTKVDLAKWIKLYGSTSKIADAGFVGNASNHIQSRRYFIAPAFDAASNNQYTLSITLRLKDGTSVSAPFPINITIKKITEKLNSVKHSYQAYQPG